MSSKTKLYLVNGALGAGKTTLVDFLVQQPEFAGARVIENEFASVSIDSGRLAHRVEEVATIAGECICCSSGEELIDILHNFAISSKAPVIVESTGVANTLRVVEKLLVSDIFEQYDLAQSLYVLDGAETEANGGLSEESIAEAKAADLVLVSKLDLVAKSDRDQLIATLLQQGLGKVTRLTRGKFDLAQLASESHILDHLLHQPAEDAAENNLNYSVIDVSSLDISPDEIKEIWANLQDKYALRRMKGAVFSGGKTYHVEATPQQIIVANTAGESLRLVIIGEQAREVTRTVIIEELRNE